MAQTGAEHILVANLPDLGKIPAAGNTPQGNTPSVFDQANRDANELSTLSNKFNRKLDQQLDVLEKDVLPTLTQDVAIYRFDVNSLFETVLATPQAFGVTNPDTAVFNEHFIPVPPNPTSPTFPPFNVAPEDIPGSLFWDNVHLSTLGHAILAQGALATLFPQPPLTAPAAIPEPATLAILAMGALVLTRRRRYAA